MVTTVSAAPRSRARREDLVGGPERGVKTVGGPEGGEGQDHPVLAAVGLEREARCERAFGEVDGPGRRA